ncbi:MAG: 5'/3'-nucleotidase SurE [Candidatus Latescibacterota bacterium]
MAIAKSQILLTNDDGVDSPLLVPLVRELSELAQVCTVVPAAECSWTSKIVSRFDALTYAEVDRDGFSIHTLTGYPADCTNIGIHNLSPAQPALLVSGINMGTNAGRSFTLSSGTIGAAVEGFLSGVPAAAFSLELPKEGYALWRRERRLDPELADLLAVAAAITGDIVFELLRGGLPEGADMVSVNIPASATMESPRRLTGLAQTEYGSLFESNSAQSQFAYSNCKVRIVGDQVGSDLEAMGRGEVSITPLRYALSAPIGAADRQRFERGI